MNKIPFSIPTNKPLSVNTDIYYGDYDAKKPISIVIHGFKGFRNWGFIPFLSESISKDIGPCINIDFSHNGIKRDDKIIEYDVSLFRKNTVSKMLDEIQLLISKIEKGEIDKEIYKIWNGEIYLLGHSLGGALSILTASENNLVKKICIWGTISDLDRNTDRQKKIWKEEGIMEFKDNTSGQDLILNVSYLLDKENNVKRFNLKDKISSLSIPICIIHGTQDFTVRLKEAKELVEASKSNPNMKYFFIEKCGHTFGIRHPFEQSNPQLDEAVKISKEFLS